ncbi:Transmembrane protein 138 [Hondaea fermentalgiana]|uniref:Transmembrane protein 138 n=1 Tax=Hondaea fermentalgiana TaxID=2315210 RepID=A0A2R5GML5_9STRA|nr:Transmembrane protein 138 [Hondaea fermentalgiana]|eukprot:GBG32142.1 Transmembrane protein 138 [Hondaea fermentalgiana]
MHADYAPLAGAESETGEAPALAVPVAEKDQERLAKEERDDIRTAPTKTTLSGAHARKSNVKRNAVALMARMENPVWYLLKSVFIYLLVFLDVFLNSSVNSDNYEGLVDGRLTNFWPFLFLIVQTSVQLFIFLTLFLMMCNTYLMRIGLPGVVLSDFRGLIVAQVCYLTLTMLRFQEASSASALHLWDMPGFVVLFVIQNLVAALYYHQVLYSTFRLADEKYYVVDVGGHAPSTGIATSTVPSALPVSSASLTASSSSLAAAAIL